MCRRTKNSLKLEKNETKLNIQLNFTLPLRRISKQITPVYYILSQRASWPTSWKRYHKVYRIIWLNIIGEVSFQILAICEISPASRNQMWKESSKRTKFSLIFSYLARYVWVLIKRMPERYAQKISVKQHFRRFHSTKTCAAKIFSKLRAYFDCSTNTPHRFSWMRLKLQ